MNYLSGSQGQSAGQKSATVALAQSALDLKIQMAETAVHDCAKAALAAQEGSLEHVWAIATLTAAQMLLANLNLQQWFVHKQGRPV